MQASTIIPLSQCKIPARAQVRAIFATAINPWTSEPQRVQVLDIRPVYDIDPAKVWKVADVISTNPAPSTLGFSVRVETLRNLSVFAVQEM